MSFVCRNIMLDTYLVVLFYLSRTCIMLNEVCLINEE